MPRFLYLMRHAQSADKQAGQRDIDRSLTALGTKQAGQVASFLSQEKTYPEWIVSSAAERAKTTAQLVATGLQLDPEAIVLQPLLYEASVQAFLQIIHSLPDSRDRILCVAHNPTITYLAEYLTKKEIMEMVPAGLAVIQFECNSWSEVSRGTGELILYKAPNETLY